MDSKDIVFTDEMMPSMFSERTALLSLLRRGMPGILPGTSEWSREIGDPSERELILFRHDFRTGRTRVS
jgi:hypothetical protein